MKEIKLTQGKVALVDDEDFEYLNQYKWRIFKHNHTCYAGRDFYLYNKTRRVSMHRFLLKTPRHLEVDHIDHNGLNNQKSNLRNCTHSENLMNRTSVKSSSSKYLGVAVVAHKSNVTTKTGIKINHTYSYIVANISHKQKHIYLGHYKTEKAAARAYNEAAKKYHGEFANLNIIE